MKRTHLDLGNRYQKEMWGLFDKYQCSPLRSFVGPLANIALFVPMFFGLQKMGKIGVPGKRASHMDLHGKRKRLWTHN